MQATRLFTVLLVSLLVSTTAGSLNAQTITHVPLYNSYNNGANGSSSISVSGIGDVNGDGSADMLVGVLRDNQNGSFSGSARIISGSDGSILRNFYGDNAGDFFGSSVSGAGDVNGDGTPDLIIGAPHDDNNGDNSGSVRVFSGSDGSVIYSFDGEGAGDNFGASVSGAGDVNGDGTPDFIVGAPNDDNNGVATGSTRVFSGSDGSVIYSFDGSSPRESLGELVSGAGDVNGDGYADLIVGSLTSARVQSGIDGTILHNFASSSSEYSMSGAGDVNGDGKADLLVSAPLAGNDGPVAVLSGGDGSLLYSLGGDSFDSFRSSVSSAGDVNGDGTPDLIVGAPYEDNNGSRSGSAHVFSGSDGSLIYTFDGDSSFDYFGSSVSGAGDVNGDGIDDFIVGAYDGMVNDSGYARVFVSQISSILGDCNHDGVVNFLDIGPFVAILAAADYLAEADIDQNGVVDFLDIQPFIDILSGQ